MPAGIHDVRLPEDIEKGAQGGAMRFFTNVNQVDSGQERRDVRWSLALGRWDVGYGIRGPAQYDPLIAFFASRRGRAFAFRFKDWLDYRLSTPAQPLTIRFPSQGSAQGISKPYVHDGDLANAYYRRITHPVLDSLRFNRTDTGAAVSPTAFEWDEEEFRLNLVAPGIQSIEVNVSGDFDVPVRFDTDHLEATYELFNAASHPDIPIVEVRPRQIRNIPQTSATLGSTG